MLDVEQVLVKFLKRDLNSFALIILFIQVRNVKGRIRYIFASLFLSLNEGTCQTGKNVFYIIYHIYLFRQSEL